MSKRVRPSDLVYRGRLAPSPTGLLHMGHAKTFWWAYQRSKQADGVLIMRNEDLDQSRAKPEFVKAFLEDLSWFGIEWSEGPDKGGPHSPYTQSERLNLYRSAFEKLRDGGFLFPCTCSRRDILSALSAPHQGQEEPLYPGTCRGKAVGRGTNDLEDEAGKPSTSSTSSMGGNAFSGGPVRKGGQQSNVTWRFRVPEGEVITFVDGHFGPQQMVAGKDFGDFMVFRGDGTPSYQLSCVVDDAAMGITEVVRGADLLTSTCRQLLLYRALGLREPEFFHTPLVLDANGVRLAKRHDALSIRSMREGGATPDGLREGWLEPLPYAEADECDESGKRREIY